MHLPKMVYFLSKCVAFAYVMKNCERFVFIPLLAMATIPRLLNCKAASVSGTQRGIDIEMQT